MVYAFEVLMEIYKECGYSERDAVSEILQHNLFGLDIDPRAIQLAHFAVMMKARQYDRRILTRGIQAQVYAPTPSDEELWEFGSLVQEEALGAMPQQTDELSLFQPNAEDQLRNWNYRRLLAQKYTAVCTNPPYLNKYNPKLKEYVNRHYKDYAGDLFSVFIYRNLLLCQPGGYCGFMSPFVWMFIKTYQNLREYIIQNATITTLIQMEYSAFEEATVPVCSFMLKNSSAGEKGLYFRLSEFKGGMEVQRQKVLEAIAAPDCGYFYEAQQANFSKIPGSPVAYWVSSPILVAYEKGKLIGDMADVKIGMGTGKNDIFVREWWEISHMKIDFSLKSVNDLEISRGRYFPYNKGGEFRLWFGNLQEVLWFDAEGRHYMNAMSGHRENGAYNFYCKEGLTWSFISSSKFGIRYLPTGCFFDVAGSTLFSKVDNFYTLGFLASCVCFEILGILNPTLNYQAGNIKNLPLLIDDNENVDNLVNQNIKISKTDWDSYETSWGFKRHPLV